MQTPQDDTAILPLKFNNTINQDVMRCYHCRCCSGGCPFIAAMDYPPNAVIRLLQFGMFDEALSCSTIWVCVGCNTCATECPMAIDIPAMMDQLRQAAMQNGVEIAEPDVLRFHQTVLDSVERYGRTHKLEIMLRFKLTTRRWLQDWQAGLKMLAKRKLDLLPSRIKDIDAISPFFKSSAGGSNNG
jgi:heterodisulfide reductase subunit C